MPKDKKDKKKGKDDSKGKKKEKKEKTDKKDKKDKKEKAPKEKKDSKKPKPEEGEKPKAESQPTPAPSGPIIKCESCKSNNAVHFCPECNLCVCDPCSKQIHATPAFAHHELRQLWEVELFRHPCPYHPSSNLQYYCVTCDTAVCSECRMSGTHVGHGHVVIPIEEAFVSKLTLLSGRVHGPLRERRDAIVASISSLEDCMRKVSDQRGIIESRARAEYEGIIQRLRREEGLKISECQHDLDTLRGDLVRIEALTNDISSISLTHSAREFPTSSLGGPSMRFAEKSSFMSQLPRSASLPPATSSSSSIIPPGVRSSLVQPGPKLTPFSFLSTLPHLNNEIDALISRSVCDYEETIHKALSIPFKDESAERLMAQEEVKRLTSECHSHKELLQMSEERRKETIKNAEKEMEEWEKLASEMGTTISQTLMHCVFCGCVCEPESVNNTCPMNEDSGRSHFESTRRATVLLSQKPGLSEEDIRAILGSGRHFFVKHSAPMDATGEP
eukprot:gnl/Carplike_NY0171/5303_a7237_191.p1 GENE.gnl/Carplike_NY0171/5303_a7237_191~~gnl/Carplike_NY0171/5303_a7237_191.p1  ORF type:complete len:502 (+),score=128.15 gnl/Carplike_NY0171/5303_a7237_191:52-1557(+)